MRIGELAGRSGVSVRALRYYEEQRLLTAERSTGGQRTYPETAVGRVQLIQLLYSAGLSSRTIAALPERAGAATVALICAERQRIEEQIRSLTHSRTTLDEVLTAVRSRPVRD